MLFNNLVWKTNPPVILKPYAANWPAMYSLSELLWEHPHVFTYIVCVPAHKLEKRKDQPSWNSENEMISQTCIMCTYSLCFYKAVVL